MTMTLCVLLWAHANQQAALAAYEDEVLHIANEYGGRVLFRGRTRGEPGEPTEVQVLSFPSEDSLDQFMTDARRTAMSAARDAAIARTEVLRVEPVSRGWH